MLACDACAVSWSAAGGESCWMCGEPGHGQKWIEVKTGFEVTVSKIDGHKIWFTYVPTLDHHQSGMYQTVSEYFFKDFELCLATCAT